MTFLSFSVIAFNFTVLSRETALFCPILPPLITLALNFPCSFSMIDKTTELKSRDTMSPIFIKFIAYSGYKLITAASPVILSEIRVILSCSSSSTNSFFNSPVRI